ncbi:phospholipid phosphatase [Sphingomonas sp. DBB INV C78]|uniref:phosphatase PAP2 family protein n=1 Tax=Sphingomonas sp. DBB INV C78 TaxID=3349434 RepID=UPI0036D361CD
MGFRPLLASFVGLAIAIVPVSAEAADESAWDTASDIGAYGLTAVAIGLPLAKSDENGALQAGGSVVAAKLVTWGLKEAFPERRPDGSGNDSFPSGHTAMAFAAAASIYNRDGQAIGIPAFAVATFVGAARIQAEKHHWYDCVAGAAIGTASGFLITNERSDRIAIIPWGDSRGGGLVAGIRF